MHCKGRCMVSWARCPPKPMWLQTNSALLWSDGVCTASGRLAFLVSIELADQRHWEFLTKTFRCYFPEQCLHCLRPRGDIHLCHNPRKVLTLWMLKEQRWVAAADSSDRTLTKVKLRNIFLLAALQSSLTKHHSGTSKRGSRLRNHNTSRQCFATKYLGGLFSSLSIVSCPLTHLRNLCQGCPCQPLAQVEVEGAGQTSGRIFAKYPSTETLGRKMSHKGKGYQLGILNTSTFAKNFPFLHHKQTHILKQIKVCW